MAKQHVGSTVRLAEAGCTILDLLAICWAAWGTNKRNQAQHGATTMPSVPEGNDSESSIPSCNQRLVGIKVQVLGHMGHQLKKNHHIVDYKDLQGPRHTNVALVIHDSRCMWLTRTMHSVLGIVDSEILQSIRDW